jgi:hypothetical protein
VTSSSAVWSSSIWATFATFQCLGRRICGSPVLLVPLIRVRISTSCGKLFDHGLNHWNLISSSTFVFP